MTNNINFNFNIGRIGGLGNASQVPSSKNVRNSNSVTDVFTHKTSPLFEFSQMQTPALEDLYSPMQLLNLYANDENINKMIKDNPKITKMLEEKGYVAKSHSENITSVTQSHLSATTSYAMQIADVIGLSPAEKRTLEKACVFHDFGKALVPTEILTKKSELTQSEKEVMDLHSSLGYELLSKTKLSKQVLNLIKEHHKPTSRGTDLLGDILTVADIYSALREERSYKNSLSSEQALSILDEKASRGEVNKDVVDILRFTMEQAT